ncbi:shikimate dehydrogenase family protein [Pacificoceanicola onchidii]|uniref:shikimate dehydrogenase family protein n=1 Tax=Pacificoceanicola onchidii TaxID=2562685 RepID=UPI00197DBC37|nr:shikimate dehydrogenase [Pacificoceanicola onchidii]
MISGKTKTVVHLAHPADHLRTPGFFNARAKELGHDIVLVPWDVAPEDLGKTWQMLRKTNNLAGVVVTIPHKETVAGLCDTLEDEAIALDVCNVARRMPDGRFHGAMFDGVGLTEGLISQGHDISGKHALLVGAGGAATAIAHALAGRGVASLRLANRTHAKAEALAASVAARFPDLDVQAAAADATGSDLIVNGTSLGMHAGEPLPVPMNTIQENAVVAEVVMQPDETELLRQARDRGAMIHKGVHMIRSQIDLLIEHLTG